MFLLPLQGVNPIIRLLPRVLPWAESRLGLQPASTCNQRMSCHCGAQAQWPMPSWRTRPPLPPREQRPCRRGHDELALQGQKHSAQGNALRNGRLSTFRSVRAKEAHAGCFFCPCRAYPPQSFIYYPVCYPELRAGWAFSQLLPATIRKPLPLRGSLALDAGKHVNL